MFILRKIFELSPGLLAILVWVLSVMLMSSLSATYFQVADWLGMPKGLRDFFEYFSFLLALPFMVFHVFIFVFMVERVFIGLDLKSKRRLTPLVEMALYGKTGIRK